MQRALRVVAFILILCIAALGKSPFDQNIEARVDALLRRMTLEEKVGQLNQYSGGQATGPLTARGNYEELIAAGKIGSLINVTSAADTNRLQKIAVERSRLRIPLLFGLDIIHGYRTVFPVPLGMASTWDAGVVERAARVAAVEGASAGIRWTFSPMVDIARDARWGRIVEGAGEDPFLGATLTRAYVRGYQGAKLNDPFSIAACAKHYVGYGAAEGGRDYNTTDITERTLRNVYLPPFHAAVEAGAATFMASFNAIDGTPAHANRHTLTDILRNEWRFRGMVVSDWGAISEMMAHGIANDGATAARRAMLAGVDMDMESDLYPKHLAELVKKGAVPMAVLDEAVRRVLRVKFALGLFDRPYTDDKLSPAPTSESLETARVAAERSFVLLKNEGNVLPIAATAKTIALVGPLADSADDMLGSWSAAGQSADVMTLHKALAQYAENNGIELLYEKGSEIGPRFIDPASAAPVTDTASIERAVAAAQKADVVILAVGENGKWMSGEAGSRASIDLPGEQPKLLDALVATGRPVVMVVFSGRPLALTPYVQKVSAVVQAWFPGVQAGPALVNVLTGAVAPMGRTPVSFPRSVGQLPLYYNAMNTGRPADGVDLTIPPYSEGTKYKTRYVDELNTPLYPFGYGLTYTTFRYSAPQLSTAKLSAAQLNLGKATPVKISVEISNTGTRDGEEIAQLYIGLRGTSIARPVRELRGYQRVSLKAGETKRVEFTLVAADLAFWSEGRTQVEPAALSVWVGPNAAAGEKAEAVITQ